MKAVLVRRLSMLSLLAFAVPASAQVGHVVEVQMPVAPSPVPAEGRLHLVYELHITNLSFNADSRSRDTPSQGTYPTGLNHTTRCLPADSPGGPSALRYALYVSVTAQSQHRP